MAASTQIILGWCLAVLCCSILADPDKIGINYGMVGYKLLPANEVATLLKNNNIGKTRILGANQDVLKALANSGIDVIVGVGNSDLQAISSSQDSANSWVNDNIVSFYPATNITYIAVGNEVLPSTEYALYLVPAMKNILNAIKYAKLQNNIKISNPESLNVISKGFPPSRGAFQDDLNDTMRSILKFLSDNGAPFMANVYPYRRYVADIDRYSLDYALFNSTSPMVQDGGRNYSNLFDAMFDTLLSAMETLGYHNVPIVVTESRWPSAGNDVATVKNAQVYNNSLIFSLFNERPGTSIETYIFSLFNENQTAWSESLRHFELFEQDETPVYNVDFSPYQSPEHPAPSRCGTPLYTVDVSPCQSPVPCPPSGCDQAQIVINIYAK